MKIVFLEGREIKLAAQQVIGKGTEADIYQLDRSKALKLFKTPDHPDLADDPPAQAAARERLKQHQAKLPAFPGSLPDRVVAPEALARFHKSGGEIVGYTMRMIENAERLKVCWPERTVATRVLCDLHATVQRLHAARIVIGDFTPLNVLVRDEKAYLIDTDSFQYAGFLCRMFTENYVDPILCDPKAPRPVLMREHCMNGDWFAFAVIAMETLLKITPFHGGVFKGKGVQHCTRPLRRISVYNKEVLYPKQALHYRTLPDRLNEYFIQTFERDEREAMPIELLESLRWKTCNCGMIHARPSCPGCGIGHGLAPVAANVSTRGSLRAEVRLRAAGEIVAATVYQDRLLTAHRHATGITLLDGGATLEFPGLNKKDRIAFHEGKPVAVTGDEVRFGNGSSHVIDLFRGEPQFASEAGAAYWIGNGYLWEFTERGPDAIAPVLRGQTQLWTGAEMGMAYFRAGNISGGFLFFPGQRATVGCADLRLGNAEVLFMRVLFSARRYVWVILNLKEGARLYQTLLLVGVDGHAIHREDHDRVEEGFHGACASPTALFVPTDEGIVRISADGLTSNRFDETADFVSAGTRLLLFRHGIYAVATNTITELRLA